MESPKKQERQNFQIEETQKYLFFIMISLLLKYSTNIIIVNMLNWFLSFPNSSTIISLKPALSRKN